MFAPSSKAPTADTMTISFVLNNSRNPASSSPPTGDALAVGRGSFYCPASQNRETLRGSYCTL
ncbi:Uncharacterised protein [Afipia felis]|uniref:Uncharacterized protein n=2 Tax=Afipia felis TaxID=1035 RepID=A0A380WCB7_AFIFE|nr:hypothetical protein HMPREF9697_01520 [Afipia felis ATCC 53690]SUU77700.1 Uncharacterised protein [Afipia felis]SUU85765.1 Uncharacterised protein [Afipia felis]